MIVSTLSTFLGFVVHLGVLLISRNYAAFDRIFRTGAAGKRLKLDHGMITRYDDRVSMIAQRRTTAAPFPPRRP